VVRKRVECELELELAQAHMTQIQRAVNDAKAIAVGRSGA
jgi:hypothetical protein